MGQENIGERLEGFPSVATVGPFADELLAEHRSTTDPARRAGLRVRRGIETVAIFAERATIGIIGGALKAGLDQPIRTATRELRLKIPSFRRA